MRKDYERNYQIERDADGLPTRLVWLGDHPRTPNIHWPKCPRCQSKRWVQGACFECWYQAPRTWDEFGRDPVVVKKLREIATSADAVRLSTE